MHITMLKTLGAYPKGHKLDLPPDIIKLLPKGCYKKCKAPWDELKDSRAIEFAAAQNKANDLKAGAERLAAEADAAKEKADQLVSGVSKKQAEARKAEASANSAIKKAREKNATEQEKRDAFNLAREAEKKDYEFQIAHNELAIAIATAGLKQIEADYAKRKAKNAGKATELSADAGKPEGDRKVAQG